MRPEDMQYHMENLEALDPDQLVADLDLSTKEIIDAFLYKACEFIENEYG